MNFYTATIGELFIICFFGFWLWFKALLACYATDDQTSQEARKIKLTSWGIVLVTSSIGAIMGWRVYELYIGFWPFVSGIVPFYLALAAGNIFFILSASIGGDKRLLKSFIAVTVAWTLYCVYSAFLT